MGRELKRVALDFKWPKDKVWEGYLNPHCPIPCLDCEGTGYSYHARRMQQEWWGYVKFDPTAYGSTPVSREHTNIRQFAERQCQQSPDFYGSGELAIQREVDRLYNLFRYKWQHQLSQQDVDALVKEHRLWDFTRVPRNEEQAEVVKKKVADGGNSWLPFDNGYKPTADEVNAWSLIGMGHDSCSAYICIKARCKRERVKHLCSKCKGSGDRWTSEQIRRAHKRWKPSEPPAGEGFQLWETTSEGSPVSPVFKSLEDLCEWCEDNATTFGSYKVSKIDWMRMLGEGFVSHQVGNMVFI